MSEYKYNDDFAKELREIVTKSNKKHRENGESNVAVTDIVWAVLSNKFDLKDDTDRAMFIVGLVTDFVNGCDVDFNELYKRALEIHPPSVEDKIKKLKRQLAELEDEVKEG